MKVYQRNQDDCLRACVATILDIPYEKTSDVMPFSWNPPPENYWDHYPVVRPYSNWKPWLHKMGLLFKVYYPIVIPEGLWIGVIPIQNIQVDSHAVVFDGDKPFHDPMPESRRRNDHEYQPSDAHYRYDFEEAAGLWT